jgi:hypothetical protein
VCMMPGSLRWSSEAAVGGTATQVITQAA